VGDLTAVEVAELAALGARLRNAGLHARALAAWAGTARLSALPARLDAMPAGPPTPAAAILALFVAGAEVTRDRLRTLSDATIEQLTAWQLIDRDAGRLRARVAVVPLGAALLVCDRLDAPVEHDLVCWPDDSSHHLGSAIPPGRRVRWSDLGFFERLMPAQGEGLQLRGLQAESSAPGELRYQLLVMQNGKSPPAFTGRYDLLLSGLMNGQPWSMSLPGGPKPIQLRQYARVEGMIDHPATAVIKTVQARVTDNQGAVRATQTVQL